MKALARRLRRLEDQFASGDGKPRDYFRIVLRRLDRRPGLKGATCRRMLWPDGTLSENVVLGTSSDGREPTEEELDQWIESFPIEPFSTKLCIVPLFSSSTHAPAEKARGEAPLRRGVQAATRPTGADTVTVKRDRNRERLGLASSHPVATEAEVAVKVAVMDNRC